jgi:hypothetical protein
MKILAIDKYKLHYPNENVLVLVDIDKFLDKFKIDSPEYFIGVDTTQPFSTNRIEKASDYISKYGDDNRWINPKSGERDEYEVVFEPTLASIYNGKLGVTDGRHRMVALKKLGYTHAYIEVPQDQKNLFSSLA